MLHLEVKFDSFSINTSNTSAPVLNLSLLPVEASRGTGYPPIKLSVQINDQHFWIVREGGAVECFDLSENSLTDVVVFPFSEDCAIVGIFEHCGSVIAVSDQGSVAFWSFEDPSVTIEQIPGVSSVQAAAKVSSFLAIGGKGLKNNLKVFNLLDRQIIYTAKATINNRLNQAFDVDIRAICFTKSNNCAQSVAVANADGQIFLYDFSKKSESSSLLHHQVLPKKSVITSLVRAHRDDVVIFTNTAGIVECYDLRGKKSLGHYKSHEGAVRFMQLCGDDSILLTASNDRHIRIFNYSTRSLLHKIYVKHVPTTLTITRQDWLKSHAQQYEDSEDEEVWEAMPVTAGSSKKSKLQDNSK